MARSRTEATGECDAGALGQSATTGSAGITGSFESEDCRVERACGGRSMQVSRRATAHDTSRGGAAHGVSVPADPLGRPTISLRPPGASDLGLAPEEDSSGEHRRLGQISRQGNSLLRFLLVEAAQVTVRSDPEWRRKYFHIALRRGPKIAQVARARRWPFVCTGCGAEWDYEHWKKFGPQAG